MKFVVYLCCTIFVLVLGLLALPLVIDWNVYFGPYIFKQLEKINNTSVKIVGEFSGSFIFPKIIVRNLYMEYDTNLSGKADVVLVDKLELDVSFVSLISFSPKIKSITAYGLKSTIDGLKNTLSLKSNNSVRSISIIDSVINTSSDGSSFNNKVVTIYNSTIKSTKDRIIVNALLQMGKSDYQLTSYMYMNKKGRISKANIAMKSNVTKLTLLSDDKADNTDKFSGLLTIESSNFSEFINDISETKKTSIFSFITSQEKFHLSANVLIEDSKFNFNDVKIVSKSIEGDANIQCNSYSSCMTDINLTKIDVDSLTSSNGDLYYEYGKSSQILDHFNIFISDSSQIKVNATVKDLKYNNRIIHDLLIDIIILDGKISVNKFQAKLPGNNNRLYVYGDAVSSNVVSKFNGMIKIYGDDLDVLIQWLMPFEAHKESKNNKFILHSNLYIAPRIFSLTNIKMITSNIGNMKGDLKIKYGRNKGNVIGNINVKDFDCGYYNMIRDFNIEENVMSLKWLKTLGYNVKMDVRFSDILLKHNTTVKELNFFANIANKKMSIERIQFSDEYGSNLQGFMRAVISSHDVRPKILLRLQGSKYDSNFIKLPKIINALIDNDKVMQIKWSSDKINFFGLDNVDGSIDINVKQIVFQKNSIKDFLFSSDLRDGLMSIKKLKFEVDEGNVEINGNVGMGDIPSLSAVLSISNMRLQHIVQGLHVTGVQGNISLSGSLKTQGKNLVEWADALDGKIEFIARGVNISDVNFNFFIKNLFTVRSKSDVASLVKVSLYNDSTLFSAVSGKSDVKKGTAFSSIEFQIDNAVGVMSANFSFVQFSVISLCRFFFVPPGGTSAVNIDMDLQGYIWQPKITFNIDSLYDLARDYIN